jgi:hypothetical protein
VFMDHVATVTEIGVFVRVFRAPLHLEWVGQTTASIVFEWRPSTWTVAMLQADNPYGQAPVELQSA